MGKTLKTTIFFTLFFAFHSITFAQKNIDSSQSLVGKWRYVSGWKFVGKNKVKVRSLDEVLLILSEDGTFTRDLAVFHNGGDTSKFHDFGKWKYENDSIFFYNSYSICNVCLNQIQPMSNSNYQLKIISESRLYILVMYSCENVNNTKPIPDKLVYDEYIRMDGR